MGVIVAATLAANSGTGAEPLGILAGGGAFPLLVAEAAMARGRAVFIFGIVDEASPEIARFPHRWIKRGQLGALFSGLRDRRIRDLVLIGGIRDRRMPRLSEIDVGGVWAVLRHIRLLSRGDDGVLRRIARFFEANGLRIVGAAEVAPELTIAAGVATARAPMRRNALTSGPGSRQRRNMGRAIWDRRSSSRMARLSSPRRVPARMQCLRPIVIAADVVVFSSNV